MINLHKRILIGKRSGGLHCIRYNARSEKKRHWLMKLKWFKLKEVPCNDRRAWKWLASRSEVIPGIKQWLLKKCLRRCAVFTVTAQRCFVKPTTHWYMAATRYVSGCRKGYRRFANPGTFFNGDTRMEGYFIMNIHKAKGKEFDEVIIWEEYKKPIVYENAIPTGRLLMRVAVTRARSFALYLRRWSSRAYCCKFKLDYRSRIKFKNKRNKMHFAGIAAKSWQQRSNNIFKSLRFRC